MGFELEADGRDAVAGRGFTCGEAESESPFRTVKSTESIYTHNLTSNESFQTATNAIYRID